MLGLFISTLIKTAAIVIGVLCAIGFLALCGAGVIAFLSLWANIYEAWMRKQSKNKG